MGKTRKGQALPVKSNAPRPPAADVKPYLYSWVSRKTMPSGRSFTKIRRELSQLRCELIGRYGGDKVSPEAITLIDSVIEALGVQKLMGLYIRQAGIIRRDSLKQGNLELHAALGKNWVSYANVVRQNLMALKELRRIGEPEPPIDALAYIEAVDAVRRPGDEPDGEKNAPGVTQERRSGPGAGDSVGNGENDAPVGESDKGDEA